MKRFMMIILTLMLCAAMAVPAFAEGSVSITLSESSLLIGTGVKLKLEVATESTEKLKYTWESSDKKIAAVDGKGTVSGVAAGEATVTCSALLGKEVVATAECAVTVFTSVKSVKAASPVKGNVIFINQPVQIATMIAPENATYPQLVWTSSDESIATVDGDGVVTGRQPGKVRITCETDQPNQAKAITAVTQFTVKQQVEEIRTDAASLVLWLKDSVPDTTDTAAVSAEPFPENAENKKVNWETSDKTVADVKNGTITAKRTGSCTVTVSAADGGGTKTDIPVVVLSADTYIFKATALENTEVVFTEDAGQAAETAGLIVGTAMGRLIEIENTSRIGMLGYFVRTAAGNGNVFLTGSADDSGFPVTVLMADDAGNYAMVTYDPVWDSFYFSTARSLGGNDFPQVAVDGTAFAEAVSANETDVE